jgi:hypothetical protein
MPRNYKQEYKKQRTDGPKRDNILRKRLRRKAVKAGLVKPNDNREVDHKKMMKNGGANTLKNTKVLSRVANRKKQPKTKAKGKARMKA